MPRRRDHQPRDPILSIYRRTIRPPNDQLATGNLQAMPLRHAGPATIGGLEYANPSLE